MSDFADVKIEMPRMQEVQQPNWGHIEPLAGKLLADTNSPGNSSANDYLPQSRVEANGSISFEPGSQSSGDIYGSHAHRNLGESTSTGSDPILQQVEQSNPVLGKILSDAKGQVSQNFYNTLEQLVNNDAANGLASTDSGIMQAAMTQIKQLGVSHADMNALRGVINTDLAANGDGPVQTNWPGDHTKVNQVAGSDNSAPSSANANPGSAAMDNSAPSSGNVNPGSAAMDNTAATSTAPADNSVADAYGQAFSNLLPEEQQIAQDLQSGANPQQLEQDILAFLQTVQSDLGTFESSLASNMNGNTATEQPVQSGNDSGFTPDPGAGPNAEAGGGTANPVDNYAPSSGDVNTGSNATGVDSTAPATTATPVDTNSGSIAQNEQNSVGLVTAQLGGGNEETGTAFSVGQNLLATDDHVVAGAQSVQVQAADGQTFNASVVVSDPANDLAILQVQGATNQFTTDTLSSSPSSTDTAVGFPLDGPLTTNSGQYAGTAPFSSLDVTDNTVADNPNRTLLQFANLDAQPGSSGSPIFNSAGQVIGVVDVGDGYGNTDATPSSALTADIAQAQNLV